VTCRTMCGVATVECTLL